MPGPKNCTKSLQTQQTGFPCAQLWAKFSSNSSISSQTPFCPTQYNPHRARGNLGFQNANFRQYRWREKVAMKNACGQSGQPKKNQNECRKIHKKKNRTAGIFRSAKLDFARTSLAGISELIALDISSPPFVRSLCAHVAIVTVAPQNMTFLHREV